MQVLYERRSLLASGNMTKASSALTRPSAWQKIIYRTWGTLRRCFSERGCRLSSSEFRHAAWEARTKAKSDTNQNYIKKSPRRVGLGKTLHRVGLAYMGACSVGKLPSCALTCVFATHLAEGERRLVSSEQGFGLLAGPSSCQEGVRQTGVHQMRACQAKI